MLTKDQIQELLEATKQIALDIYPTATDFDLCTSPNGIYGVFFSIPGATFEGIPVKSFIAVQNENNEQLNEAGEWVAITANHEESVQESIDFLENLKQTDPDGFQKYATLLEKLKTDTVEFDQPIPKAVDPDTTDPTAKKSGK